MSIIKPPNRFVSLHAHDGFSTFDGLDYPQEHIDFMLSKIPRGRFLDVVEAASMITWLCSEDNSFSTGAVFDLSGGRATY